MALEAINFCFSSAPPACILIMFLLHLPKRVYAERECMRGARAARVSLLHEKLNSRLIYGNQFMRFDHREGPCFVPVGSLL